MSEYRFHGLPHGSPLTPTPSVALKAESTFHGAALALRHFMQLGCDITAPLAHVDVTEADGSKHTLLIEEVRDWLSDPKQTAFVQHEDLAALLPQGRTISRT
jgi:hypothetical protein